MCGICGQFNFASNAAVDPEIIRRMAGSIAHRGPDDEGYFVSGPIGLGFRRLSIIDLAGGHQPMADAEKTVWVIFNGEIYNFKELRVELEQLGYCFRTNCDTEVIVHGYLEWGTDVLNHLNGMFGLAIWDVKKRRLVVARDAMGIKLIYYRLTNSQLTFGSEMRPVLAAGESSPDVDPLALNLFLRFRYTPSPLTIFQGVRKLAPGTMLVIENGECKEQRWYNYRPEPFEKRRTEEEATKELLELYRGAVKRHLLSDVPLGILLSGGLDSGLLLALMNEQAGPWPAYTIGYGKSFEDDELKDAAETAALLGARHVTVKLDQAEFERTLPNIVECLEEPIAASSIVPMYLVSQRARQDVKVAIIGQGPDELFGGYKRHLGVRYGAMWAKLPGWMRTPISSTVAALPRNEMLKRGVNSLAISDRMRRYQYVLSLLPEGEVEGLFQDGLLPPGSGDTILNSWQDMVGLMESTDELGGLQFLEMRSTLPDELLMYADKLSMAHGLELRVPFVDKEIVEYVERLPANFKVRNGSRKWLHRQVGGAFLPESILKRPKRGFAVNVVDDWFKGAIDNKMADTLRDRGSKIYQYLRPTAVSELFEQHSSGRHDNHKVLFSLVLFEEWLRANEEPVAVLR